MPHLRKLAQDCYERAEAVAHAVAAWSTRLWRRLTSEPGYAERLLDVLLAAVDLLFARLRLHCLVDRLVAVVLAVIRVFRPHPGPDWN